MPNEKRQVGIEVQASVVVQDESTISAILSRCGMQQEGHKI